MLHILVVERDHDLCRSTVGHLRRHGYLTSEARTGQAALRIYGQADLVILDLDLPDVDGLEVCRQIRAAGDTSIISATTRATEFDRVLGLRAGADDCVNKPYSSRELVARIEAVLRRAQVPLPRQQVISRGCLHIDREVREVHVDGHAVEITRKEFDLLYLLASRPEQVISREQLMAVVWGNTWAKNGRTIDTHISSLRGKLGASSWITTVRGIGYRLGQG